MIVVAAAAIVRKDLFLAFVGRSFLWEAVHPLDAGQLFLKVLKRL